MGFEMAEADLLDEHGQDLSDPGRRRRVDALSTEGVQGRAEFLAGGPVGSGKDVQAQTDAGWPGAFQPPAPTDPDVKVSLYPAPLTRRSSKRMGPLPLGEQAGLSRDQPVPPPLEPFVGP